jgi:hypothetical protein
MMRCDMTDEEKEKLKAIDEIKERMDAMDPDDFRAFLQTHLAKLDEILEEANHDVTWSINAFERQKRCCGMFMTWDEYFKKWEEQLREDKEEKST